MSKEEIGQARGKRQLNFKVTLNPDNLERKALTSLSVTYKDASRATLDF